MRQFANCVPAPPASNSPAPRVPRILQVTYDLYKKYGEFRLLDTPICEYSFMVREFSRARTRSTRWGPRVWHQSHRVSLRYRRGWASALP